MTQGNISFLANNHFYLFIYLLLLFFSVLFFFVFVFEKHTGNKKKHNKYPRKEYLTSNVNLTLTSMF